MSVVSALKEVFGNNEETNLSDAQINEIVAINPLLLKVLEGIKNKGKVVEEPINPSTPRAKFSEKYELEDCIQVLNGGHKKINGNTKTNERLK